MFTDLTAGSHSVNITCTSLSTGLTLSRTLSFSVEGKDTVAYLYCMSLYCFVQQLQSVVLLVLLEILSHYH